MTLNRIACIASMLLLACAAYAAEDSEVSSNIDPIGFRCSEESSTLYLCDIVQVDAATAADMNTYTFGSSWNDFVTRFMAHQSSVILNKSVTQREIRFISDIHLGGKTVKNGKTACVGDQVSQRWSLSFSENVSVHVSGQNHTIYGYCSIKTGGVGFFSKMSNALVEDLNFSDAYVESEYTDQTKDACAAVFADSASGVEFSNVSIKKSTVVSETCSGGIVGVLSGDGNTKYSYSSRIHNAKIDMDITGPIAGGLAAILNNKNAQIGREFDISSNTVNLVVDDEFIGTDVYVGGLVGEIYIPTNDNNIRVSKNTVTLDVKENENGLSLVSTPTDFFVGGLAGSATLNSKLKIYDNKVTSATVNVKRKVDGDVYVGGEIGLVQISNFARTDITPQIDVTDELVIASIQVNSKGNEYLGGIMGNVAWADRGDVEFSRNQIRADIESENGNALTVNGGGLVGSVTEDGPGSGDMGMFLSSIQDKVTFSLLSASEKDVVAGGLFGYVSLKGYYVGGSSSPNADATFGMMADSSIVKSVEGKALIKTTATANTHVYVGGAVGEFEGSLSSFSIRNARTQGDITVAANSLDAVPGAEAGVGGIAGKVLTRRNSLITGNASEGDVRASIGNPGFIIGILHLSLDDSYVNVISNYHYGNDDPFARDALGKFYIDATPNEVTNWKEAISSYNKFAYIIKSNYRNALDGLNAEGNLNKFGTGTILMETGDSIYSGIIPAEEMKSRLFSFVLSTASNNPTNSSTWDNEPGELPVVSKKRSSFQVSVNIEDIYDQLSDDEKFSIKEYLTWVSINPYVVAYTDKNGKLPSDFLDKMDNLSVDFVTVKNENPFPLDSSIQSDIHIYANWNRKFTIVYEADEGGLTVPLDDVNSIFLWPRVTSAWQYWAKGVLPAVLVKEGGSWMLYGAEEYRVPCKATACTEIHNGSMTGINSFEQLFSQIEADYSQPLTADHADTLYIKYVNQGKNAATISVADEGSIPLIFTLYGYDKSGKLVAVDSSKDEYGYFKSDVMMTSRIGMHVGTGYKLKNWQADVWIANESWVASANEFEDCYGSNNLSSCYRNKSMDTEGPYLASPDSLYYYYDQERVLKSDSALKWTVKQLKPSELLDMDSVLEAFVPSHLNNMFFHVHVIPDYEAIPYKVSFDFNTTADDLFFTDKLYGDRVFSLENYETAMLPKVLSLEACFDGWLPKSSGASYAFWDLNSDLIETAEVKNDSFAVFATWTDSSDSSCTIESVPMMFNEVKSASDTVASHGSLYLWQSDPNDSKKRYEHHFENGQMELPVTYSDTLPFYVSSLADSGYKLKDVYVIVTDTNANAQVDSISWSPDNALLQFGVEMGLRHDLFARFVRYITMAYDLNTDNKNVFFGVHSFAGDSVDVEEEGGQVHLPRWVYTADACVLGWAVKSDAKTVDYFERVDSDSLLNALSKKKRSLYAVWGDVDECVKDLGYANVRLVSENGTVVLDEYLYAGFKDSSDYRTHEFTSDSTMLLPESPGPSKLVLRAAPQPGYKLDSMVVFIKRQNGSSKDSVEEYHTFLEGDTISITLPKAVFTAYFSEGSSQQLEFVRSEFRQSGSAIRLVLETDSALAKRAASFQVVLLDALGNIVPNTDVTRKLAAPYSDTVIFYPLLPGVYELQAGLGSGAATFDTVFTVAPEIAVAPNEWRMVSLGSVDMESIVWDDDPVFYWWDESSLGGEFWQYNSLKDSKKVDHEVGYWYNSLEGRPLKFAIDTANSDTEVHWEIDSIYSGWNLVANPYNWSVDIKNTEGFSNNPVCYNEPPKNRHGGQGGQEEWSEIEFWKYDPVSGNYALADTIGPFEGVWVKTGCSKVWGFNAKPVFPEPSLPSRDHEPWAAQKSALAKASAVDSWTLQAKLVDGKGKVDAWNVLGVGSKNVVAEEPPEAMGDHVNLSIVDGKRLLAKSVKAGTVSPEWTVELSASSNRTGYLSFEGVGALREYGLKVFVTVDGKTTEMRDGEPLKVALTKAAKYATVRVAESAPVVLAYQLGGVRAFQVGHGLQVSFDVSNGLAGKTARVDLVDLKGHIVSTATGKALVGANTVAVEAPLSGLYVVRVRLGGKQSVTKVLVR